jgi:hypothetical protein
VEDVGLYGGTGEAAPGLVGATDAAATIPPYLALTFLVKT